MKSRSVYRKAVEILSNYEPETHYRAIAKNNHINLVVLDPYLKSLYGSTIELEIPSQYHFILFFIFIGEHTPTILLKYQSVLNRLTGIGLETSMCIYDCDVETSALIYMIDRVNDVLKEVDHPTAIEASSLLVLVKKYSKRIREIRDKNRTLTNNDYYEYQYSLEKLSKYMNRLLRIVRPTGALESLLEIHEIPSRYRSKRVEKAFHNSVLYYTDIVAGECPEHVVEALGKLWLRVGSKRETFILLAEPIVSAVPRSSLPIDHIIPVNLEV